MKTSQLDPIQATPPKGRRKLNASTAVSAGILLSRILGLVREQVFAHYLGSSDAAGAFRAALRIPNFLQNLFGEGVLSASFIPVYSRLRGQEQHDAARVVAGAVGSILAVAVSVMVLIGVSLTPWIVDLVAPGFHGDLKLLTIQIVRILFPGVGLLVLSAWCLGILNSHRKFFLSYVAPVFWNLAMIGTLVIFGRKTSQDQLVVALAWGSVFGSFLQLAVQVPFVFKHGGRIKFLLKATEANVREVFRNLGPVFISRGVVQLSAYIDGMIASFLGAAAVADLGYAQTIYLLPISLFGMAVAAAELPEMSAGADESEAAKNKLRDRLKNGRKRIAFFVIPSAVAFLFLGRYLIAALYQSGRFGFEDTLYVWYILIGSVVGLLAATWGRLYSSAFYALRDTKTPLRFAIVRVVLTIVLGLLFAFPLRPWIIWMIEHTPGLRMPVLTNIEVGLGAVGLTGSAGMAGWVEFVLLKRALEKRIGESKIQASYLIKIWSAALVGAAIAIAFAEYALPYLTISVPGFFARAQILALLPLAIFGLIYLGLAYALKITNFRRR